ncbi:MAG: Crp/Fnr family transcriptional regulator [Bacteroidetes bacterium]|nr:Crp/Fnr family transcriptional regulator [Bacteroidota bacterium]
MKTEIEIIISSNPVLNTLFSHITEIVLRRFTIIELPPHSILIRKGEKNLFVYIKYEGKLRIINEFDNGRMYEFASVSEIGFSGLLEMFAQKEIASSTVETMEKSKFLRIRKEHFSYWLEQDSFAFRGIVRIFANQIYPSILENGVVFANTGSYSLGQYLERRLVGDIRQHGFGMLEETRQEIAQNLGVSLRTIYRLTGLFRDMGIISVIRRKITMDAQQLKHLREFLDSIG